MKGALSLAYMFEQELLCRPRNGPGVVSSSDLADRFQVSRSLCNEAVRILQSREVVRAKTGPNGGFITLAPTAVRVGEVVLQYMIHAHITHVAIAEAREAVAIIRGALPAHHPGVAICQLMSAVLGQLADVPGLATNPGRNRATGIARQIAFSALRSAAQSDASQGVRLGHEQQLCEQFGACRPVVRQAIRILQAQCLVETRRGRGRGLFLAIPQPGPVTRLIALWLLGDGLELRDILDFERLLRKVMALLASKGLHCGLDNPIFELQHRSEAQSGIGLVDVIEIEKNISWLTANPLLDLFLRSMTVYKVGRGNYRHGDARELAAYLRINRYFLRSLMARQEGGIERACQEKNEFLREYDLYSAMTETTVAN